MKPILFNTEMTRAILDGRKSCTRRLVKPHNTKKSNFMGGYIQGNGLWIDLIADDGGDKQGHVKDYSVSCTWWTINEYIKRFAPYKVGDILYVRETWLLGDGCAGEEYYYKADETENSKELRIAYGYKWHPSIHMPKEAARIFLKVTDVRVEKLQDITEEQIRKEGLSPYDDICQDINWKPTYNDPDSGGDPNLKQGFEILWNTTVKEDWQKWESNPYVWVIEFERCEKPEATT